MCTSVDDLHTKIIVESNGSRYSIHAGSTKLNHDLKNIYWWNVMKKDIAEYVAKCPKCQQIMVEHRKRCCLTQIIKFHSWKWEDINMDFMVGLPKTKRTHDSIQVIVDMITKSAHFIPVKSTYRTEDYVRL